MIYFIENTRTHAIKIGFSNNPAIRLRKLRTGSCDPLFLLGSIPGYQPDEAELHRRFARHRRHGEWFADDPEMRGEIVHLIASGDEVAAPESIVWDECLRRNHCRYGLRGVKVRPLGSAVVGTVRHTYWDRDTMLVLSLVGGVEYQADECVLMSEWPEPCGCYKGIA